MINKGPQDMKIRINIILMDGIMISEMELLTT